MGVREVWQAGMQARDEGAAGAETFLKEVVWRGFAWHRLHHFPALAVKIIDSLLKPFMI